jgi:caffeoyl-CoA O-methyltransferase
MLIFMNKQVSNNLKTLEEYIFSHIDSEPELLKKLSRETYASMLYPRMLSGHLQGRILKMICRMIRPESILEIGTFTGYSAICMAEGITMYGSIDTIEINDELESFIRKYIAEAGFEHQINLLVGDALEIIPTLDKTYDFVFIDGNKRNYTEYYKMVMPLVRMGGFILADNVLWSGKVIDPDALNDEQTKGIIEFNQHIKDDPRVEKVIFPIRDGFTIIQKIAD